MITPYRTTLSNCLPKSPIRHHYVKAKMRVHEYPDGTMAIFHGPRKLADYDQSGKLREHKKNNQKAA